MAKYSVFVSGRLSKVYEIEADTKENAMINALEYFNSVATTDYTEGDIRSGGKRSQGRRSKAWFHY